MSSRIIVIDDDESMRLLCLKALRAAGHRVSCTGNPLEALAMLDHEPADLLIVDVLLAPPVLQLRSNKPGLHFDTGHAAQPGGQRAVEQVRAHARRAAHVTVSLWRIAADMPLWKAEDMAGKGRGLGLTQQG